MELSFASELLDNATAVLERADTGKSEIDSLIHYFTSQAALVEDVVNHMSRIQAARPKSGENTLRQFWEDTSDELLDQTQSLVAHCVNVREELRVQTSTLLSSYTEGRRQLNADYREITHVWKATEAHRDRCTARVEKCIRDLQVHEEAVAGYQLGLNSAPSEQSRGLFQKKFTTSGLSRLANKTTTLNADKLNAEEKLMEAEDLLVHACNTRKQRTKLVLQQFQSLEAQRLHTSRAVIMSVLARQQMLLSAMMRSTERSIQSATSIDADADLQAFIRGNRTTVDSWSRVSGNAPIISPQLHTPLPQPPPAASESAARDAQLAVTLHGVFTYGPPVAGMKPPRVADNSSAAFAASASPPPPSGSLPPAPPVTGRGRAMDRGSAPPVPARSSLRAPPVVVTFDPKEFEDSSDESLEMEDLLPNWAMSVDPSSGDVYFYNTENMETSWQAPLSAAAAAARQQRREERGRRRQQQEAAAEAYQRELKEYERQQSAQRRSKKKAPPPGLPAPVPPAAEDIAATAATGVRLAPGITSRRPSAVDMPEPPRGRPRSGRRLHGQPSLPMRAPLSRAATSAVPHTPSSLPAPPPQQRTRRRTSASSIAPVRRPSAAAAANRPVPPTAFRRRPVPPTGFGAAAKQAAPAAAAAPASAASLRPAVTSRAPVATAAPHALGSGAARAAANSHRRRLSSASSSSSSPMEATALHKPAAATTATTATTPAAVAPTAAAALAPAESEEEDSETDDESEWQAAVDPSSGDTYYYNTVTGETSWELRQSPRTREILRERGRTAQAQ